MTIKIKTTTKSPLCQIENSDIVNAVPTTYIKKMKLLNEDNQSFETPYYSGNGFRGLLRRKATELIIDAAMKNDISLAGRGGNPAREKAQNFTIMNSGGGSAYSNQKINTIQKIRKLNPLVSILGVSLAIPGKINVTNLIPLIETADGYEYHHPIKRESGYSFSPIISNTYSITSDDILDFKGNAKCLSMEEISEYQDSVNENTKQKAIERNSKEDKGDTKKIGVKQRIKKEFIIPGVNLYNKIDLKENLTSVETGFLILSLQELAYEKLGSSTNAGYGLVEYRMDINNDSFIESKLDMYGTPTVNFSYDKEVQKDVDEAKKWLDNISEENIQLDHVFDKDKKDKKTKESK